MKTLFFLAAFTWISQQSIAQDSKVINDKNAEVRNVKGFHAIRISSGIDLYLSQGTEAVAVSASNTEFRDKIKTVVEDGILKIYIEQNEHHWNWNMHHPQLKAYVSVTNLDDLRASGGSDVFLEGGLKLNKLGVELSGGSDMKGKLDVNDLSTHQSGGSDINISGRVANLNIESSGGSDFSGYELVSDICHISASGGSDTYVTVNKELDVMSSGGSDTFYKGEAVIKNVNSSGSSTVKKKG